MLIVSATVRADLIRHRICGEMPLEAASDDAEHLHLIEAILR